MGLHKIDGIKLDEETYAAVKKMAERGVRTGKGERKAVTMAEMCSALVHTGVFRRIAANKWAKAHPEGKKPKARKPAKKAVKKPAKKAPEAPPAAAPAAASSALD